jgi:uncharacterized OsmC-like protein
MTTCCCIINHKQTLLKQDISSRFALHCRKFISIKNDGAESFAINMANIVNNTNLYKIAQTIENGKRDRLTLKKPVKLQGEWNLDRSKGYQFKTDLSYEKDKQVIEIDSPSFLGGNGNRLGPMAYCVAGIASCFIATFVGIVAGRGIRLTKLNVNTECMINFAKTFDVADEPITEGINFQIEAESDNADKQQLQELVNMAEERCPAMYSRKHEVKINTVI